MVLIGLTLGLETVEVKLAGELVQLYLSPVTVAAPIEIPLPVQIAVLLIVAAAGNGFTEMVTEFVLLHPVAIAVSVRV